MKPCRIRVGLLLCLTFSTAVFYSFDSSAAAKAGLPKDEVTVSYVAAVFESSVTLISFAKEVWARGSVKEDLVSFAGAQPQTRLPDVRAEGSTFIISRMGHEELRMEFSSAPRPSLKIGSRVIDLNEGSIQSLSTKIAEVIRAKNKTAHWQQILESSASAADLTLASAAAALATAAAANQSRGLNAIAADSVVRDIERSHGYTLECIAEGGTVKASVFLKAADEQEKMFYRFEAKNNNYDSIVMRVGAQNNMPDITNSTCAYSVEGTSLKKPGKNSAFCRSSQKLPSLDYKSLLKCCSLAKNQTEASCIDLVPKLIQENSTKAASGQTVH